MTDFASVPVDEVRAYWNARPCNIRHSPSPVGTKAYFDEVEARKYFVEPHIPGFAEFPRWAGKRVLEIGCGIGTDTISFARAGARVTAVDLSEESIALARQRAELMGLADRITFHCGNAEELPSFVPVEEHDLVYSFGVIHHAPHPERILEQARQYLKPGGTLKVMVYNRRSWKVLAIALRYGRGRFWDLRRAVADHSEAQFGCPVTYTYSTPELAAILRRLGYTPDAVLVDHIFPWRIPDYVQYRYKEKWQWRWLPDPVFRALERRFGWHLCTTAHYDPPR